MSVNYRLQTPAEQGDKDYITAAARRYFSIAIKYANDHNVTRVRVNATIFEFLIDAHEPKVRIYTLGSRAFTHPLVYVGQ